MEEMMMSAWGEESNSSTEVSAKDMGTTGVSEGNASMLYAQSGRRDYARLGQVPLVVPRAVLSKSTPPQSSSSLAAMDNAQQQQRGGASHQRGQDGEENGGRTASGIRKWEISKASNLPEAEKDTFADTLFSNPAEDDDWVVVPSKKRQEDADSDPKSANAKLLAAIATKDQEMILKKQRLDTIGHAAFTLPAKSSKETATHLIKEMQMNAETNSHVAVVQQINALEAILERRGKKLPVKMQLRKAHMEAEYYDHLATGKPAASQQKGSVRGAGVVGATSSSTMSKAASNRASLLRTEHRISYTPHDLQAVNIGPRANPNIVSRWRLRHLNSKLEAEKTMTEMVRQRDAHRAVVTGTKGVIGSLSKKLSSTPSDLLLARQEQEGLQSPRNQATPALTSTPLSTSPRSMSLSLHPKPPSSRPSTGLRTFSSQSAREGITTASVTGFGAKKNQAPRPLSARDFVRSQSRTALTESARRQPVIGARIDNIWTQECRELAAEAAGDLLRAQVRLRILSFLKRKWWTDRQAALKIDVPMTRKEENYGDVSSTTTTTLTTVAGEGNTYGKKSPLSTTITDEEEEGPLFALPFSESVDEENAEIVLVGGGSNTGVDDPLHSGLATPISIRGAADSATSGATGNTTASSHPSHRHHQNTSTAFRTPSKIHADDELEKANKKRKEAAAAQAKRHSDVALEVYREFEASEFPTQSEERELFYTLLPLALSSTEAQMLLIGMFEALTVTSADLTAAATAAEKLESGGYRGSERNPASYTTTASSKRNQYGWKLPNSHKSGMRSLEDLQHLVSDCCREWVHNAPKAYLNGIVGGDFSKSIQHHRPSAQTSSRTSPLRNRGEGYGNAQRVRVPSTASGSNNHPLLEFGEEEDELLIPSTSEGKTVVSFVVFMLLKGSLLDTHDLATNHHQQQQQNGATSNDSGTESPVASQF
jgi:hypothetical protein